ncbi:prolyl 3-hydroxylase OGFOD1-like [Myxocyprinus asiaticus]|uniref:prolyl 3-hydroxylase OGFOD1-like n=1 Tax=Myxocyprinus asiaticus TaxID=70543 RepID=UPI002223C690|nr:prolyl 3-hydroxylase OGFOD1-like [Myxocyprinus asiaticus]
MSPKKRQNDSETGGKNKKEKRGELAVINSDLRDESLQKGMRDAWQRKESYSNGSVQLDCEPFPHCQITHFLQSESFVESLQAELFQLNFNSKSNDLYKFQQSDDLRERREHHISQIRSVIFGEFRLWLSEVLQVDLEAIVDISCAKYEHTDVLLCHDDELEGRRVAFILYLVPPWELTDGGTLDLFSTDEHCQPVNIAKSLLPRWNSLVFFEVSPVSFHQVAEVLTEGKCRLSLSGWFHGHSLPRPPRYMEPPVPRHTHIPRDESVIFDWVNEMYLDPRYQARVQQEFEDSSEICLPSFLQEEKFRQVRSALQSSEIQWERRGPPNKRCYSCADMQNVPSCLKECWELLSSEPFFILLSNLTGLRLHYLAQCDDEDESDDEKSDTENEDEERSTQAEGSSCAADASSAEKKAKGPPTYVGKLRRWARGDYTLLHDSVKREYGLDLQLHMGCAGWKAEFGGFTSYIAHDEDEELLTVYPEDNSLALVYRDKDTLKFIKHINNSSSAHLSAPNTTAFYDFCFNYYE